MPSTIISLKLIYPMSPWLSCCYSWTGRFTTLSSPIKDSQTQGHDPNCESLLISQKLPSYQANIMNKMGFSIGTDTLRLTRHMWFVTVGCGQKSLRSTGHTTIFSHYLLQWFTDLQIFIYWSSSPPPNFFFGKGGVLTMHIQHRVTSHFWCYLPLSLPYNTVFTWLQGEIFSLNWLLSTCNHLKLAYEALNRTAPNRITLKWTMWSQRKAYIAKSSCEIRGLLGYYTA